MSQLRLWKPQDLPDCPDFPEAIVILSRDLQVETANVAWGAENFMAMVAVTWHDSLRRSLDRAQATEQPQSAAFRTVDGQQWDCRVWPLSAQRLAIQAFPAIRRAARRQRF